MILKYKSDGGEVIIGDPQTGQYDYWLSGIDGLEQVRATATTVTYVGQPGQVTLSKTPEARTISISGMVRSENGQRRFLTERLCAAFDNTKKGTLTIYDRGKIRRIEGYTSSAPVFGDRGFGKAPFTLTITCDNPFFKDGQDSSIAISSRVDNLLTPMTFPRVFTYRNTLGVCMNNGALPVLPIIRIVVSQNADSYTAGLRITNRTTGSYILLNYNATAGETIEVDTDQRTITSSRIGDLLFYKSTDTQLQDFLLVPGKNEVEVTGNGDGQIFTAHAIYSNLYSEAVF